MVWTLARTVVHANVLTAKTSGDRLHISETLCSSYASGTQKVLEVVYLAA